MSDYVNNVLSKNEVVSLVDRIGTLQFVEWYKNSLFYENKKYRVELKPDYRDRCGRDETLKSLLELEDYCSVAVYDKTTIREDTVGTALEKPTQIFFKKGDN